MRPVPKEKQALLASVEIIPDHLSIWFIEIQTNTLEWKVIEKTMCEIHANELAAIVRANFPSVRVRKNCKTEGMKEQ